MKPESEFMTALNRRTMLLFGGGLAAVGLGTLAVDAKKKKKKKKKRKKKTTPPRPSFVFTVPLMAGSFEVPGPGDNQGGGSAEFVISNGEICAEFTFDTDDDQGEVTQTHIHRGNPAQSGPPVVDFNGLLETCVPITDALANEIGANAGGFYANIHTEGFPDGAVRGQLYLQ